MNGTFNAYGQTEKRIGGNVPVWLGTVSPAPIGGRLGDYGDDITTLGYIPAGWPCQISGGEVIALGPEGAQAANCYAYNDVVPVNGDWMSCTVAVVMAHNEGLLIDRVPRISGFDKAKLKAAVPNVILISEA